MRDWCGNAAEMSAGHLEVHTAVVDVPDPRVDKLCEIYKPKKRARKVTYAVLPGWMAPPDVEACRA